MQDDFAVLVPLREVAADTKQHSPMLIASADEPSCSAVADVKIRKWLDTRCSMCILQL